MAEREARKRHVTIDVGTFPVGRLSDEEAETLVERICDGSSLRVPLRVCQLLLPEEWGVQREGAPMGERQPWAMAH